LSHRTPSVGDFCNLKALEGPGLTANMLVGGVAHAHGILDMIDTKLVSESGERLSSMIELANLSSVVGNLLGAGIAKASDGLFKRNGPHKYPDLLAQKPPAKDVEIKVALETNKPKGHLAKAGYYVTCRYVLCDEAGAYTHGKDRRGSVVWIWEIRCGYLETKHLNLSNTAGDSGKTAVLNTEGLAALQVVYCDLTMCPFSLRSKLRRHYTETYGRLSSSEKLF